MNKKMLKSKMALFGDTGKTLAEALGISPQTLSSKMNETNGAEFTQREIAKMRDRYSLTASETVTIFFGQLVT